MHWNKGQSFYFWFQGSYFCFWTSVLHHSFGFEIYLVEIMEIMFKQTCEFLIVPQPPTRPANAHLLYTLKRLKGTCVFPLHQKTRLS